MPPKKAKKMGLNEFLGEDLGSWADEMDAILPTAPAARTDGDRLRGDRRRDDYMSSRPDRGPAREDLPLPTEPPFIAFVGNLAFDITELELEDFFGGQTKSVKIIRDRDEKPKGFGYVEFNELDGLKEAIAKSGSTLAGRGIRVSVAEPPKERSGFGGGGGFDDDAKFAGNWRREGPLPDLPGRDGRDAPRRRFEGGSPREPPPPSLSDNASDWRSSRPPARHSPPQESEGSLRRRGPGSREPIPVGPADTEETWQKGSKLPTLRSSPLADGEQQRSGSRFGSARSRGDMGPPPATATDEGDWRRSKSSTSPNSSTPPTPQMSRRKLELLPRSSSGSAAPSPLASPNPSTTGARPNPFGDAKPVDVRKVEEVVERRIMSRTSSRTGSHRPTPPATTVHSPTTPKEEPPKLPASNVRPSFSFAKAAAGKDGKDEDGNESADKVGTAEKIEEVEVEASEQ